MEKIQKFNRPIAIILLLLTLTSISASNVMAIGQFSSATPHKASSAPMTAELCSPVGVALIVGAVAAGAALVSAAYQLGYGLGTAAYHASHGASATLELTNTNKKIYKSNDFSSFDL